jgi:hypothetical protein
MLNRDPTCDEPSALARGNSNTMHSSASQEMHELHIATGVNIRACVHWAVPRRSVS